MRTITALAMAAALPALGTPPTAGASPAAHVTSPSTAGAFHGTALNPGAFHGTAVHGGKFVGTGVVPGPVHGTVINPTPPVLGTIIAPPPPVLGTIIAPGSFQGTGIVPGSGSITAPVSPAVGG